MPSPPSFKKNSSIGWTTSVTVAADEKAEENQMARCCRDMQNQTITFQAANITDHKTLEELQPGSYDHIILL